MITKYNKKEYLFISWDGYDIRHECYANILGGYTAIIEKHYINRVRATLAFITKALKTYKIIKKLQPSIVVIKSTHFIIAAVSMLAKSIFNYKLVFDSHSCSFENGLHYPQFLHRFFTSKCDLNIVTNKIHQEIIKKWGGKALIINFPPIQYNQKKIGDYPVSKNYNICYIQTYNDDEPYWEVIRAIEKLDDITLYITGDYNKSKHELSKSANITHTGFLKRDKYLGLIQKSDIIIVLTTRENTMQRGANEAIFLEKPVITSNTKFLKNYFYKGCIHVATDSKSILMGIQKMRENYPKYKSEVKDLKNDLYLRNKKYVLEIKNMLNE